MNPRHACAAGVYTWLGCLVSQSVYFYSIVLATQTSRAKQNGKILPLLAGECRAFLASGSAASQTALTRRWVPGAEKPRRIYNEHEQSHLPRKHTQP